MLVSFFFVVSSKDHLEFGNESRKTVHFQVNNEKFRVVVDADLSQNIWLIVLKFGAHKTTIFIRLAKINKMKKIRQMSAAGFQ